MADSIKIPLEIFTKDALAEIKRFSQNAEKNLKLLNKATEKQNDLLEETNSNLKVLTSNEKAFGTASATVVATLALQSKNVRNLLGNLTGLNIEGLKTSGIFKTLGSGFKSAAKVTGSLAEAAIVLDKGVVGLSLNLSTLSLALLGIGKVAESTDNEFISLIGRLSIFASLITGSLSVGLIFLIKSISRLAFEVGTSLVDAAKTATQTFIEFDKKTFVFERTLTGFNRAFGESIGTVESWNKTIAKVSEQTGFTEKSLRGAVTEIIATTSAMGFNEKQQKRLLEVTTDYARFLGDDVVQTTIEFISALNGQAQSVQKYGVKLGATNIQQKLYNKGLNTSFQNLGENEKVQIRFNSLLEQYAPIAGNAAAVAGTLAGQQLVLNNNITRLSQSFGEGAAIIENNNLVAAGLNLVLSNISENVLSLAGFLTSLGGRLLQVGGLILGVSFNVLAAIKVIKILNVLLETNLFQILTNTPIPFFNKSLLDLVRSSGAAFISFKSLGDILKTFASIFISQSKIIIAGFAGIEVSALSLSTVLKGVFVQAFTLARLAVTQFSKVLLKLLANPIVLVISGIVAGIFALAKAIAFVEKRTGIFTDLFGVLGEVLRETSSIFDPILNFFSNFGKILSKLTKQIAGGFIVALSKVLSFGIRLVQSNPFNIFSKEQVQKITDAKLRLDNLSTSIVDVNFDISKLKNNTSRSIASINDSFKKVDLAPLLRLQEELKDVGLTDIDKLKRQREERLAIIQDALKSEGKAAKIAKELELKINEDFNDKVIEIRRNASEKSLESMADYRKNILSISNEIESSLARSGQSIQSALSFQISGKNKISKDIENELKKAKEEFDAGIIDEETFELRKKDLAKQKKDLARNAKLAFGTGIANSLARGSQGAKELATGLTQLAADAFVPGLGQAAGPLLDIFAQGPEATKEAFNQFAETVPTVIENIILSIPAAIQAIADNVDKIIIAIVDRVDEIIIALVKAMPEVSTALALALAIDVPIALVKSLPQLLIDLVRGIPQALIDAFRGSIGRLGSIFWDLGKSIFTGLFDALAGGFNILRNLFSRIFSFFGGGTGAVEDFLGFDFPFIAFAKGGIVPGRAMTSGDSSKNDIIPALLSPGEMVIPRSIMQGGAGSIIKFLESMGVRIPGFFIGGIIGDAIDFLGDAIGGVVNTAGDIVGGVVGEIPVVGDIAEQFIDIFNKYREIIESLARIGASINLRELIEDPFGVISNAVRGVLDFFKDNFRNLISAPFARGGLIPSGFNNDNFPARLTSGELVIDRSTTTDLQEFLSSQRPQNSGNDTIINLLTQLVGLMRNDQKINASVEFNQDVLADIILNLSRNNVRLA